MIADIATRAGALKVIVVMNCFDPLPALADEAKEIHRSLLRGDGLLIVYVGGLFAGRGLEEVVEAVSRVDGVRLFMGGYGPLEGDLRSLARRLGPEDKVVFGGEIDPADVPRYDAAADVLLAMYKATDPNNVLTIPNKLFESIAAGKPIIVSNIGEKSRLVSTEGIGIVVDPSDVAAIADAIRTLKGDRRLYEAMAASARRCQERYSWARMAATLNEGYAALLPERRVPPDVSGSSPC
jgi:glycosyltransferase involved in cell wall biosynthesis